MFKTLVFYCNLMCKFLKYTLHLLQVIIEYDVAAGPFFNEMLTICES